MSKNKRSRPHSFSVSPFSQVTTCGLAVVIIFWNIAHRLHDTMHLFFALQCFYPQQSCRNAHMITKVWHSQWNVWQNLVDSFDVWQKKKKPLIQLELKRANQVSPLPSLFVWPKLIMETKKCCMLLGSFLFIQQGGSNHAVFVCLFVLFFHELALSPFSSSVVFESSWPQDFPFFTTVKKDSGRSLKKEIHSNRFWFLIGLQLFKMDAPVGFEMSNLCEVDPVEPIRAHITV